MEPSCSHCLCNIHVHTFRFSLHGCTESASFCFCRAFGSYIKESMTDAYALLLPVPNCELDVIRVLVLRLLWPRMWVFSEYMSVGGNDLIQLNTLYIVWGSCQFMHQCMSKPLFFCKT